MIKTGMVPSIIGWKPDSTVVYHDDILDMSYNTNWDAKRIATDGIIISYTLKSTDNESIDKIKAGTWAPHYLILRGGGIHPNSGKATRAGQIIQCVSEAYVAFHCREGYYMSSTFSGIQKALPIVTPDRMTIGIAIVCNLGGSILEKQQTALSSLIADITTRHSDVNKIIGRRHVGLNTNTNLPIYQDPDMPSGSVGIDYSDQDIFGSLADTSLNYNVTLSSDGQLYVLTSRGLKVI